MLLSVEEGEEIFNYKGEEVFIFCSFNGNDNDSEGF